MSDQPEYRFIPSYIKGVRTTESGKSVQFTIESQEVDKETLAYVFGLIDKYGYTLFAENPPKLEDLDLPDFAPEFKNDKTPSQRLRAVLFIQFKQENHLEDFDTFYKRKMEELIDGIKAKLKPDGPL